MAKNYRQYLDSPVINAIQDAGSDLIKQQGFWGLRKNSLTAAAQVILQLANILLFIETDIPVWVTVTIAAVVGIAEIIVQAGTKASVAPSVIEKMKRRVADELEVPSDIETYHPSREGVVSFADNVGNAHHKEEGDTSDGFSIYGK